MQFKTGFRVKIGYTVAARISAFSSRKTSYGKSIAYFSPKNALLQTFLLFENLLPTIFLVTKIFSSTKSIAVPRISDFSSSKTSYGNCIVYCNLTIALLQTFLLRKKIVGRRFSNNKKVWSKMSWLKKPDSRFAKCLGKKIFEQKMFGKESGNIKIVVKNSFERKMLRQRQIRGIGKKIFKRKMLRKTVWEPSQTMFRKRFYFRAKKLREKDFRNKNVWKTIWGTKRLPG